MNKCLRAPRGYLVKKNVKNHNTFSLSHKNERFSICSWSNYRSIIVLTSEYHHYNTNGPKNQNIAVLIMNEVKVDTGAFKNTAS